MKRKLVTLLRIMAFAAVLVGWCIFYRAFEDFHRARFPALYSNGAPVSSLLLPLFCFILLTLVASVLVGHLCGYKLLRLNLFFLEISKPDKLRVRLSKRLQFGVHMLPPRTDGTSPYILPRLSSWMFMLACTALIGLLTCVFWRTRASWTLVNLLGGCVLVCFVPLLPMGRNDLLTRLWEFHGSRDLRRAWECMMHISAAIERDEKPENMPDEWFLPYPEAIKDHIFVQYNNYNRAIRLTLQKKEAEGYEILRYFFDLKPAPSNYMLIAGAILNGALCEVFADLPPMCLSQLDHDVLKAPLPPEWERGRLTAQYARALFLHHDEAEAAAILPALEKEIEKQGKGRETLERLQEKAGLLPKEEDL